MAVDYYHHLIAAGPHKTVAGFAHRIAMVQTRRVAGVTTRAMSPFSFASLYAMAELKGELPSDPYDMARWPVVRRGRGAAEVRYRFHTRNLEVDPLVRRLSRKLPRLTFALVTNGRLAGFSGDVRVTVDIRDLNRTSNIAPANAPVGGSGPRSLADLMRLIATR